jgi:2,3-bisphosphoglycerate-dependent phosphoglycerate mutase
MVAPTPSVGAAGPGGWPRPLVLLRHGQSEANAADGFSGWLDVPLSDRGRREALAAGRLLRARGLVPDVVHTSQLRRAGDTAVLALAALGRPDVPIRRTWRLNERHYGALQGRSRAAVRAEYGDELFHRWRRSFDTAPPPAEPGSMVPAPPGGPPGGAPRAESLADVLRRVLPCWEDDVLPDVRAGRLVLVVAHSNSLRALCAHLDSLGPAEVEHLNVPTGVPLRYDLDAGGRPARAGGQYLDPAGAAAGIAEVLAQGGGAGPRGGA